MMGTHLASLLSLLGLLAQDPTTGFAAEAAARQPVAVERGLRFLNYAYTAVWIVLAVYLFTLSVRLRRLGRQVARLKERAGL